MYGRFCPLHLPPLLSPSVNNYIDVCATFKDTDDALVLFVGTEAITADLRVEDTLFILAFQNITTLWIA